MIWLKSIILLVVFFPSNGYIYKPMLNKFLVNCDRSTCNGSLIIYVFVYFNKIRNTN